MYGNNQNPKTKLNGNQRRTQKLHISNTASLALLNSNSTDFKIAWGTLSNTSVNYFFQNVWYSDN